MEHAHSLVCILVHHATGMAMVLLEVDTVPIFTHLSAYWYAKSFSPGMPAAGEL